MSNIPKFLFYCNNCGSPIYGQYEENYPFKHCGSPQRCLAALDKRLRILEEEHGQFRKEKG